jgi:hypothetical protein
VAVWLLLEISDHIVERLHNQNFPSVTWNFVGFPNVRPPDCTQ